jgi:hypothetical protein
MPKTKTPPVVRTLHPPPLTMAEIKIREAYADEYFDTHEREFTRVYRGVLFRTGAAPTDENVQDLRTEAWRRIARGGDAPSLISRYDPALYGPAEVLGALEALNHWIGATNRGEAVFAAKNINRRTGIRRSRELSDNGR